MAAMLEGLRGITGSVGYGPLLALTLPRNMRHMAECRVITSPEDEQTQEVACSTPGVRLHVTDDFTAHGAKFNKGLHSKTDFRCWAGTAGFSCTTRTSCSLPPCLLDNLQPDRLYGCRRRILEDPSRWHPDLDWRMCPFSRDNGCIGYFQCFHADDPALAGKRPWYDVSFTPRGGGDAFFLEHWHPSKRVVLPFDVLHLGRTDMNWFGCDQARPGHDGEILHRERLAGRGSQALARGGGAGRADRRAGAGARVRAKFV